MTCASTCAIIKTRSYYAIVDSHVNNTIGGQQYSSAASFVMYCQDATAVYCHVFEFSIIFVRENKFFEITG